MRQHLSAQSLFQQFPLRNQSYAGYFVYSHSGEFSPRIVDFVLPGRRKSFMFIRKYRSSYNNEVLPLGRGWTFSHAKRVKFVDKDILYHDGLGREHLFKAHPNKNEEYLPPIGFYGVLLTKTGTPVLTQRDGTSFTFERPENDKYGRLLTVKDTNGNAIIFKYMKGRTYATDPLGHNISIIYNKNLVTEVRDHAGRVWKYKFDINQCLIEVIFPSTETSQEVPRIRYGYDNAFRLTSITDMNGQTFLRNSYDDQSRVIHQHHGNGYFEFSYEILDKGDVEFPIYRTEITRENGSRLILEHDTDGHVVKRMVFVSLNSLSPEDRPRSDDEMASLITTSEFNPNGEHVKRIYPAGNIIERVFDEENKDRRAEGNLLKVTRKPSSNVESNQEQIITSYTYEPKYQRRDSITNPRGNTLHKSSTIYHRFDYDILNRMIRRTVIADGREIIHCFIRDANENIIRKVDPLGNISQFSYDERNLLLEKHLGVGTKDHITSYHTYTANGRRRSTTHAGGDKVLYDYDGFHRYRGLTNAAGTVKKLQFDECTNITSVEVIGDVGRVEETDKVRSKNVPLRHTRYHYDELNRQVRMDRSWVDSETGKPLGKSKLVGEDGLVSTITEYADNHLPSKVLFESGDVLTLDYDGVNRLVSVCNANGGHTLIEYNKNGSPVRIDVFAPEVREILEKGILEKGILEKGILEEEVMAKETWV